MSLHPGDKVGSINKLVYKKRQVRRNFTGRRTVRILHRRVRRANSCIKNAPIVGYKVKENNDEENRSLIENKTADETMRAVQLVGGVFALPLLRQVPSQVSRHVGLSSRLRIDNCVFRTLGET
jgi:hypothetical protein